MSEIALLTNKTFLLIKDASADTWSKLIDITKYPQIGGEPEQIEVTRLTDLKKRYINGLQDTQSLTFEANYLLEDYRRLNAEEVTDNMNTYRLCFGDELGTDGCFEWSGKISVFVSEGESNAARKMTFTISDEGDTAIQEVEPLTEADIIS